MSTRFMQGSPEEKARTLTKPNTQILQWPKNLSVKFI